MKKPGIIILLLIVAVKFDYSQDTSLHKFFPLQVGNKWIYYYSSPNPPTLTITYTQITRDTIINSKKYYWFVGGGVFYGCYRYDSLTNNILTPSQSCIRPYSSLIDSLNSKLNDTAHKCSLSLSDGRRLIDTNYFVFNTVSYRSKMFRDVVILQASDNRYAKNLGLVYASRGDPYAYIWALKGALINGVVYGDTSLTGLIPISTEIPESYSLQQNYPNPFNPVTKINFSIPSNENGEMTNAKLTVLDALGREIIVHVNELLKPGIYEVEWNASAYPSGVYFYMLQTEQFTQTKKMVLIK